MSNGKKKFGSLTPKLGEILGSKKFFTTPSPQNWDIRFSWFFAYDLEIELAKNPENLIKFSSF